MTKDVRSVFSRIQLALRRRGNSEQDAEDIVQDAWLRMALYRSPEPIANPEGFLMRTALNLAANRHRDRVQFGELVVLDEEVLVDLRPGVEDTLLAKEQLARMEVCLSRLSEQTREIFLMHRIEQMSFQEIGRRCGLSSSGVQHHVAKASLQIMMWMKGW